MSDSRHRHSPYSAGDDEACFECAEKGRWRHGDRGGGGATAEPARQNFHAEIKLGALTFRGDGECLALATDFPQAGLFAVRCQLVLSGLPAPYVGGLLTTNTMTSKAVFGGDTMYSLTSGEVEQGCISPR